jgi:hypothetical protein
MSPRFRIAKTGKGKQKRANYCLFAANGNGKQTFVFLGGQMVKEYSHIKRINISIKLQINEFVSRKFQYLVRISL